MPRKQLQPLTHRTSGNGKRLTQTEKLIILQEKQIGKKSVRKIAKEYGVANSTVMEISQDERLKDKLAKSEHIKKGLAADFYLTAGEMLGSITRPDILKINAYQRVIAAAAATDKALRIEEGAPQTGATQIQVTLQLNQLQEELKGLLNLT